ncbi:MAG: hypothetical protein IPM17_11945 [Verrucomicrobia bacterium]|nr:hypothetical protein [Verrucomicrobiota bacterium]
MIVKILCSCGTKYSFEVEPVNGRLPAPVNCPNCNVDGTEAANEYVRQMLAAAPAPAVKVVPTPAAISTPPSPTATGPGAAPPAAPAPLAKKRGYGEPNILMGTLGAVGAALLGMLVWYLIIVSTNTEFGIIAWGVGGLTGLGCRLLGGGYSQKLGIIAGACAFVAIVGGEYLATRSAYNKFLDAMMDEAWEQHLAYAKEADQLTTDDEIKAFLAKHGSEEGEPAIAPETITADQVREFRQEDLPELKKIARGGTSKAGFERKVREHLDAAEMQSLILKDSFSLWTLLWLFLGVGTAYRLGVGATE